MTKLETFAELLEKQQKEFLIKNNMGCLTNLDNRKTSIRDGKKYVKVDVGGSGKYMIEKETEAIYGIKAYGVIHKGHKYGTLDTINDWYWGGYKARRLNK